ncbi:hypothetical protein [Sediminibacterium sp. C3]|uniref:hypothetical protein n=1 Tax=Sediminibacterium sp. C3 TaxID=1267211 RepID=UPI000479FB95|nr:hypothetical protein [Sediminibacterium sp. C3]
MICSYRFCQQELPSWLNGNRRYCNDECNYLERLEREKEKNLSKKKVLAELNRIQTLLRKCHVQYGSSLFDVNVLREQHMNWTIITGISKTEGCEFRIIGSYAYVVFDDNQIKIIQL